MSYGFRRRRGFEILAAVDAEHAKPCEGPGRLDCNATYEANIGVTPLAADLEVISAADLAEGVRRATGKALLPGSVKVLICCPPCTDFSRAKPSNHQADSPKNSLVLKTYEFVEGLRPEFLIMENAREMISGRNSHHYRQLEYRLRRLGYDVKSEVVTLTRFGLPQVRERSIVIASRIGQAKTLSELWGSYAPRPEALTVRHAISALAHPSLKAGELAPGDPMHVSPGFANPTTHRRLDLIPQNGGSWFDLASHPEADVLLTRSMKERLKKGDLGSHPDVYGRLNWDKPSVTVKRECAHVGNGRYSHPEQTRLLTVREMATLQGFPSSYVFHASSLANRYRHIGDAVPPMISYQLSAVVEWMKTGIRPSPEEWLLPFTSLVAEDIDWGDDDAEVSMAASA